MKDCGAHARAAGLSRLLAHPALLFVMLFFVFCSAWAASLNDVRTAFNDARDGKQGLDATASVIQAYLDQNPDSPVAIAYKGSVRTLQGAQHAAPWKKMIYINEGFGLLDKAVSLLSMPTRPVADSVAVEVLLISGMTNASVPKMFNRRAAAKSNFETLLVRKSFHQLPALNQARAYAWLAVLTHGAEEDRSADYLTHARRLDGKAAEEIWSKR